MRHVSLILLVVCCTLLVLVPSAASAQTGLSGTIAGVVKDSSGGVLPGVTVEAASPALIEKTRTVVTDAEGEYKIVDLRPGTYAVSFTLPGFNTFLRQGIELTTGFTATVNAELKVGALEETITITGASPVVDVQNTHTQAVLDRNVLEGLPYSNTSNAFLNYLPNIVATSAGLGARDVGGTQGDNVIGYASHGSDAGITSLDGIKLLSMTAANWRQFNVNPLYTQEVVLETGSGSAEAWSGGVNINIVPRDGGNTFHGLGDGEYTGHGFDTNNLNDYLRARGLTQTNRQKDLYDVGGALGGPIVKDKLWFYASPRDWGNQYYIAGNYFNATPNTLFYTPNLSQQATFGRKQWDISNRLTWQVAPTHKLVLFTGQNHECYCPIGPDQGTDDPGGGWKYTYGPERLVSLTYTHPATSRLLIELGYAWRQDTTASNPTDGVLPTAVSVLETTTGLRYGSNFSGGTFTTDYQNTPTSQNLLRGSASYITGSHALKVGFSAFNASYVQNGDPNYPYQIVMRNQIPIQVNEEAAPNLNEQNMRLALGLFAQDQWTLRRLTVNAGIRFDYINAYSPAQTRPGGEFGPPISFSEVDHIPDWKDINPRLGLAYDLFGNGKTAVKVSLGRYDQSNNYGLAFARSVDPEGALVTAASRTWTPTAVDIQAMQATGQLAPGGFLSGGNYCNLANSTANGECGAISNSAFGNGFTNTQYASGLKQGWEVSPYIWEGQASVTQELASNVALTIGYYRTWYGNIYQTDNLDVTTANFTSYCVTAPANALLPGGGGYPVCGLYNVAPTKFGQVQNSVSLSSTDSQVYNGVDVLLNARFGQGRLLAGGLSTGQTVVNNCGTMSVPPQFCQTTNPWSAQTALKLYGVYPLPWWGLQTSATYQNLPGIPWLATDVIPNATIAPSLGRNLAGCPAATGPCNQTASISLIAPYTQFEPRNNQLDARLSKILRFGRTRWQANLDVFNLTNAGTILTLRSAYGPTWLQPNTVMAGRLAKLSLKLDF